jgi:hypothetical protein
VVLVVLPFWPPSHIATNIGLGLDDVGLIADPVQQRLASGVIEVGQFRRAQPEGRNRVGIVGRRFRASDREACLSGVSGGGAISRGRNS